MTHPVSPLAPAESPRLPAVAGVRLAARECNIRYKNRTDVMLMEFAPGTTIAGVLTRSLTRSAPVDLCRKHLKSGKARAILVNSGNANAFTGKAGIASVERCTKAVVAALKCKPSEVYLASTGVIGEPLPEEQPQQPGQPPATAGQPQQQPEQQPAQPEQPAAQ